MRNLLLTLLLLPTIVSAAPGISIPPVVKILELKPYYNTSTSKLEIRYIAADRPNDRIALVAANKEVENFFNDFVTKFEKYGLDKLYCQGDFSLGQVSYPFIEVKSISVCVDEDGDAAGDSINNVKLKPAQIATSKAFIANARKEKYPPKEVNDSSLKKEEKIEGSPFSDEYLKKLAEKKKKKEQEEETSQK
ncbi:MAG: hypothetical protein K2Q18_04295 [Bdellovibrionales bacterium]|nr:hypothetical protein [Bdellovibrionales bacterium]